MGAIKQISGQYPDHQMIFTGGGAAGLNAAGIVGDWRPDLVLEGLLRRAQGTDVAYTP